MMPDEISSKLSKNYELLSKLSEGPLPEDEAKGNCGEDLEYLLDKGLLRREEGKIYLAFAYFPKEDYEILNEIGNKYSAKLLPRVKDLCRKAERALRKTKAWEKFDRGTLKMMAVGCYSLDLGFTSYLCRKWKLSGVTLYYAGETFEGIKEMLSNKYWGCHSYSLEDRYTLFSFGNHVGKRNALPDLLYSGELSEEDAKKIVIGVKKINEGKEVEKELKELLEKYGYLKEGKTPPYMIYKDEKVLYRFSFSAVFKLVSIVGKVRKEILEDLKKLRASSYARTEDLFMEAWHWIFGEINGRLVEEGEFSGLEEGEEGARYIKWISEASYKPTP